MTGPNGHFDLDAKRKAREAAGNEAAQTRWTFTFGDREFSFAPVGQWPGDMKRMIANGDLADAIDAIIDDPDGFWQVDPRPTNDDINDLFGAWGEWSGSGDAVPESSTPPPVVLTRT